MLPTIAYKNGILLMIDQRKLPLKEIYIEAKDYKTIAKCIKDMVIRGAPAIGVAAAYGVAIGAKYIGEKNFKEFHDKLNKVLNTLAGTRPTAVNLFWAINRMRNCVIKNTGNNLEEIKKELIKEAISIEKEDIEINKKIGINGAKLILSMDSSKKGQFLNILTYCNAGSLATAGYGTAISVIRFTHQRNKKIHVFTCETRPYLQGARLTAWELNKLKIPFTLITDNMAGYLMSRGKIDYVVTGADRIALNGDTANKIGTYTLATLAKENKVPFYIAAPISSIDFSIKTGEFIPIEERSPSEVTHIAGKRITLNNIKVFNPAFDVTPAKFIKAIITEKGIILSPYKKNIKQLNQI